MNNKTKKGINIVYVVCVFAVVAIMGIAAATTSADSVQQTAWALFPPVIAIVLALVTKEVYSSLFIGIVSGALLYSGFDFEGTFNHIFFEKAEDGSNWGLITQLSDSYNVGILVFLVILGILVALMNRAGGSAAFGTWASSHIKSRVGAQLATVALGVLIFVDDYFNCLTVGSVMRPVTDKHHVSRAKLAYLIDATAAPICIIAPISSWAAAVSGFVPGNKNGIALFVQTIPWNYYALLTIAMMIILTVSKTEYGPMALHEKNAILHNDLYTTPDRPYANTEEQEISAKGKVIDLVLPVIALVVFCVLGMIYTGGFFAKGADKTGFIDAFAGSDASVGLVIGSFFGLVFTLILYLIRRVLSFKECMDCIPEGFKAMIAPILILTFAWTLKGMTDSLGAAPFVAGLVEKSASGFMNFLPAIIFLIAVGLSFATGTSWGTFGILIPIVVNIFDKSGNASAADYKMMIIAMSACMAGAVCGDHCSPISDTTIMSSAGAQSNHLNHVTTQLPYALTCALVSFVSYVIAGFTGNAWIALPCGAVLLLVVLLFFKRKEDHKWSASELKERAQE
uniref:Na+/H+ antiporter NhaC family protein n=1 Tax=Eubacterium cellulosolvens TaxID=29322 RepID=UPI0005515937|nr:Na+/H+ antiporter NhaC family protein [[Eubacterium] cellulosolvens]